MAISLEHCTRVCPAALHRPPPSLGSSLPGSRPSGSFRSPPTPSSRRRRHDSTRRRAAMAMHCDEAADGRASSGRDQPESREDASALNALHVDAEVTKRPIARERSIAIPCLLMRGGTSRGTVFMKQHLPQEQDALDRTLLRVMGSPDRLQIDGLGGASSITSKVAILSRSTAPGVDVDYTFAQVMIDRSYVDWEPTCGNILAAVGPAAIEMGLVPAVGHPLTAVRIRATNNGAIVDAVVQTPNGAVTYDGDAAIDGVQGTAAPVSLSFTGVVGSTTGGQLLPTGRVRDRIAGVEVTCIDVAMPLVIARASSFGKTGYESPQELDADVGFFRAMESIRVAAGRKMGLGDVTGRVVPKFAIVAEPREPAGSIAARYFVPFATHASMAVTGAICIASCSVLRGSVADELSTTRSSSVGGGRSQSRVVIEHPSGRMAILLDSEQRQQQEAGAPRMTVSRAGVMRTARLIFEGSVHIQADGLESFPLEGRSRASSLERYRRQQQLRQRQLQQEFRKLYRLEGWAEEGDLTGVWMSSSAP